MPIYLNEPEDASDLSSTDTLSEMSAYSCSAVDWWRAWTNRFYGVPSKTLHPKAYACMVDQWKERILDPALQYEHSKLIGHGDGEFDTRGVDLLYNHTPHEILYYRTPSSPEFDHLFYTAFPDDLLPNDAVTFYMCRRNQIFRDDFNTELFQRIQRSFNANIDVDMFHAFIVFALNHDQPLDDSCWGAHFQPSTWDGDRLERIVSTSMYKGHFYSHLSIPLLNNVHDSRYPAFICRLGASIASMVFTHLQNCEVGTFGVDVVDASLVTLDTFPQFLSGYTYEWSTIKAQCFAALGSSIDPLMAFATREAERAYTLGLINDYRPDDIVKFFYSMMDSFVQEQRGVTLTELSL